MEKTPIRDVSKKKKSNKILLILPWIGSALLLVVIVLGAYFYATKQPITVLAPSGTSVTVIVCGDDTVSTYNAASMLKIRAPNADLTPDLNGLSKLDTEIRLKSGFDNDPTCQTILFWNAIINNDVAKAAVALTAIEKLHDSHHYADSNLENTTSISVMKDSLSATTTGTKG
jgi:hypothetical protein